MRYTKDMTIYFSGVGGVGIGPLMEIAHDAGYDVAGSDTTDNLMTNQLRERGLDVFIGQTGQEIARVHAKTPIDWLVYTAAAPADNPERLFAEEHGIHSSKRDEFLAQIIAEKQLKLIAVAGTHGKTTTTGMFVWLFHQLGLPVSYSVGSTLSFAPSGVFSADSQYFIYECDEYDRNMLHFTPYLSVITSLDYDHPDTYKTEQEYKDAFVQFLTQSRKSLLWEKDLRYLEQPDIAATYDAFDELMDLSSLTLAGDHIRHNAFLVQQAAASLELAAADKITAALCSFPGTARRFEKLADNLYSDYGHHPAEITATLQMARELADRVTLVYQPHQNIRQHEVRNDYTDVVFQDADTVYWLPTYLSREDPTLPVLTPEQLSSNLSGDKVRVADLDDELWQHIKNDTASGCLVLVMGAGSIDAWVRARLAA